MARMNSERRAELVRELDLIIEQYNDGTTTARRVLDAMRLLRLRERGGYTRKRLEAHERYMKRMSFDRSLTTSSRICLPNTMVGRHARWLRGLDSLGILLQFIARDGTALSLDFMAGAIPEDTSLAELALPRKLCPGGGAYVVNDVGGCFHRADAKESLAECPVCRVPKIGIEFDNVLAYVSTSGPRFEDSAWTFMNSMWVEQLEAEATHKPLSALAIDARYAALTRRWAKVLLSDGDCRGVLIRNDTTNRSITLSLGDETIDVPYAKILEIVPWLER